MVYLIILKDGRLRQVEQLTDEILADFSAGRLEIVQVPVVSGSILSKLADVGDDEILEWSAIIRR